MPKARIHGALSVFERPDMCQGLVCGRQPAFAGASCEATAMPIKGWSHTNLEEKNFVWS